MPVFENTSAIGIDIGTASVRACVIRGDGIIASVSSQFLSRLHHPEHPEFITQSSTEIWNLVKSCVKTAVAKAGTECGKIQGISVDATCSLVVLKKTNKKLEPYPADWELRQKDQNVILWMDHRAAEQAKSLNSTCRDERFMQKIGGAFIPEMGVPKMKYLVEQIPEEDLRDVLFCELHDFVSIMLATDGDLNLYATAGHTVSTDQYELALDGSSKGWSRDLLEKFGLSIIAEKNFAHIGRVEDSQGSDYLSLPYAGSVVGEVCDLVKQEIGLPVQGTVYLGHGVIDCYAGWIATVRDIDTTLSMVAGTSTCYLVASASEKSIVPGVWGPFSNFIKDHYISEGGQSSTGSLIEHLFASHPAFNQLIELAEAADQDVFAYLDGFIDNLTKASGVPFSNILCKHMFVYGNILGNRTPYADPDMRGAFVGEDADLSLKNLALKYLATLEFLALETRQITETLSTAGYNIDKIALSGSQSKNRRLIEMIEATTGKIVISYTTESPTFAVVKGAAMLGLAAAHHLNIADVMRALNLPQSSSQNHSPNPLLVRLLNEKYKIMVDIAESQIRYRSWINKIC